MLKAANFFNLDHFHHRKLFSPNEEVWRALDHLEGYLSGLFVDSWPLKGFQGMVNQPLALYKGELRKEIEVRPSGPKGRVEAWSKGKLLGGAAVILPGVYFSDEKILIGPGTVVEPGALIKGPTVIGQNTEVRQGAYIRGNCLVGDNCVVGHTTEVKSSIMMDGAKAGHFAYLGDSIVGNDVNLGAGTKLANLKIVSGTVWVHVGKERFDTGRNKLGAILGDGTETGCNSVTSPGTLIGRNSIVYPCLSVPSGFYPEKTVKKM